MLSEPGGAIPCDRAPCDEAAGGTTPHATIPWPVSLFEFNPVDLDAQITLCVRLIGDPDTEGSGNTPCTFQVDVISDGHHDRELRINPNRHCSQLPQVSVLGHLVTTSGNIEVAH